MTQKRSLLIDFDGTLVDSIPIMQQAYFSFLKIHNVTGNTGEFAQLNGPRLLDIVKTLKKTYGLPGIAESLRQRYHQLIGKYYQLVQPAAGAEELLQKAAAHNWQTIIVTSNNKSLVETCLTKHNLMVHITDIVSGHDVSHGKPHPEPYLKGLAIAQCHPADAIAVEDTLPGAQAALSANVKTYCLINHYTKTATTQQNYEKITWINRLADITALL